MLRNCSRNSSTYTIDSKTVNYVLVINFDPIYLHIHTSCNKINNIDMYIATYECTFSDYWLAT